MGPGPFTPDPLGSTWPAPFPWLSFGFSGPVPGFALSVVTPPAEEPVTAAQAKLNARVTYTTEDGLFALWIPAARQMVEDETGLRVVSQTLKLELPSWPADGQVRLGIGPVTAVNSVKYYDAGGVQQTLAEGTHYQTWLGYRPPLVLPAPQKFWPVVQFGKVPAIEVQFVAGYASAAAVPERVKQAVLLLTTYWWNNRGDEDAPQAIGAPPGFARVCRSITQTGYR